MREILFRGKRVDNGEWVYGAYYKQEYVYGDEKVAHCIITTKDVLSNDLWLDYEEVIPETVGQYTGLNYKNGKKVFEGDIMYIRCGHGNCVVGKAIVYFDEELLQYRVKEIKPYAYDSKVGYKYRECDFSHIYSFEVIGNIHDNPELLKGE